jgi:hypothetical protein
MMIRGFGRNEHGSRRLEDFDADDNEIDETMVGAPHLINSYNIIMSTIMLYYILLYFLYIQLHSLSGQGSDK